MLVEASTRTLIELTECCGEHQQKRRKVWINPAAIVRFHRDNVDYGRGVDATRIRFGNEDWIWVEESPEYVAAELGWA